MSAQSKLESFQYAQRVCGRLGRRLQDTREGLGKSRYGLWQGAGTDRQGCLSYFQSHRLAAGPTLGSAGDCQQGG